MGLKRIKTVIILLFSLWLFYNILLNNVVKYLPSHKNVENDVVAVSPRNTFIFENLLNSSPCTETHKIILLVTSYVGHVELRSSHRKAYSSEYLATLGIKRVFLIAKIPSSDKLISQRSVENEHERFEDFVQGDFIEAYRNLTYKHLMGLNWAADNCPDADYVFKMDDDIVFNINHILRYIDKTIIIDRNKFLMGYVMTGMRPIRLKLNKWYVTRSEYRKSFYPPFLSGWMYVTTPGVARILVGAAQDVPYFWIDDVFVTGVLSSKAGIKLTSIRYEKFFLEHYELLDCCMSDMINKNITCEYGVGPNGNDYNMIYKFVTAIHDCDIKHCMERPVDKPLNETCVSVKNLRPLYNGNPVINILKL